MRVALLSDIHANREAMEAVELHLKDLSVDSIFFIGDVVGYGPDPNYCTDWVRENAEVVVAGNHDFAAVGLVDPETFNVNARDAIRWTTQRITEDNASYLAGLPLSEVRDGITVVHANPRLPEDWGYIFTLWDAENNFDYFGGSFCFVGHSHQPVIVRKDPEGSYSVVPGDLLALEDGCRYLINVGSVGQPRDGNSAACIGVLGLERGEFSFVRIPYDVRTTQEKMIKEGLPLPLSERLWVGR